MGFRESLFNIGTPGLQAYWASRVQYAAAGIGLDALAQWMVEGQQASMPGIGTPDALPYIARDRNLDRGPNETNTSFATRLSSAFDTWATAGSPGTLLQQLAVFFTPSTATPLRLVSNNATWHTINLTTGVVTRTQAANWTWDGLASTAWFRGWVIIDSTAGPWLPDYWSSTDSSTWGDGGTWGSNATLSDVAFIKSIVDKWRPANVAAQVIVTFSSTLFRPTDTSPPNPSGTSDTPAWRVGTNALYWSTI